MNFNLAVILQETALAFPDRPSVVYAGGQLSYAELDALSSRLAAGLESAGVGPGDLVGLQLPNISQFLIAYFGILKAGAVVVPLNVMLKPPEIAFQLSDSGVKLLITWGPILGDAVKGAEVAGVGAIYAVGRGAQATQPTGPADPVSVLPFEHLLAAPADGYLPASRTLTDTAVVVYTSGTTGRPKGAMLTHIQLYMNADIPGRLFDVRPDDVVITVLPLFHVFGLSSILNVCVRFGCTMSLIPRFTPPRSSPRSSVTGPPSSRACPPCSSPCWSTLTWTATTCRRSGWRSRAARPSRLPCWTPSRSASGC